MSKDIARVILCTIGTAALFVLEVLAFNNPDGKLAKVLRPINIAAGLGGILGLVGLVAYCIGVLVA